MKEKKKQNKNGMISADVLKIVAAITMLIDHIGAGILENWMLFHYNGDADLYNRICAADALIRCIGRISFPLYCYLLVQGFMFTRSRAKYALRLLLFAFLSELPFDWLFFNGFTMEHQNVFWTLLIGLVTLILMEHLEHLEDTLIRDVKEKKIQCNPVLPVLLKAVTVAAVIATGMMTAHFLNTDYSWKGVMLIALIYLTRPDRMLQTFLSPTLFLAAYFLEYILLGYSPGTAFGTIIETKWTVYLPFLLTWRCNSSRVLKKGKWFFYIFYPAHILLLVFVRFLLYL